MPDPILESWEANAEQWIEIIAGREIKSRTAVTNEAIVRTATAYGGSPLLDLGCGEGWLSRELSARGFSVTGADAVETLVAHARRESSQTFYCLRYQDFITGRAAEVIPPRQTILINFALLDKEVTEQLLIALHRYLLPGGRLIVQTLHPCGGGSGEPYADGWRPGSWNGMPRPFVQPYPWYFRTLSGWINLWTRLGYAPVHLEEPLHPDTGLPASLIMVVSPVRSGI